MRKLAAVSFFALTLVATNARADAILIDFEAYPDGKITNGYNGWQVTNPAYDQAVVSSVPGGATPIDGNKSWRTSRLFASGSFGDQPFSPALGQAAGETALSNSFSASWLMQATTAKPVDGDGISIAMDNGTGARGNQIRILAEGGVWKIIADDYDAKNGFTEHSLGTLSSTTPTQISWTQTFVPGAGNDVWTVSVDGGPSYTGTGWEDYFRDNQPADSPVNYDRLLFRAGGSSVPGATGILIDDIAYATPEPTSLALFGLAVIGLGAVRRRMG